MPMWVPEAATSVLANWHIKKRPPGESLAAFL